MRWDERKGTGGAKERKKKIQTHRHPTNPKQTQNKPSRKECFNNFQQQHPKKAIVLKSEKNQVR